MTGLPSSDLSHAAATLAVALGCGLLVGVERERRKGSGPARALAGLRSFALASVLGAAAALTGLPGVVTAGAAFVAGLGMLAYFKDRSTDPGVTTEIALLLTYLIGVLAAHGSALAAGLAVVLTTVLAVRERAHRFVRHWLRPAELRDGLLLLAIVLLGLPLLPDQPLWGQALNPRALGILLVMLLVLQSLAHLARRLLAARHAVALSALASGFVSSTATIAAQGVAAREGRGSARLMAGGGLLSCVPTQVQVLMVAAAVQPAWLACLWWPALAAAGFALAVSAWLLRDTPPGPAIPVPVPPDERMFSFQGALAIAALLAGIQALVQALRLGWGDAGVLVGVLLGSMADLHSSLAAVFAYGPPGATGQYAVAIALLVHAASKTITAAVAGGRSYVLWLAPGLWAHTGLGVALLLGAP